MSEESLDYERGLQQGKFEKEMELAPERINLRNENLKLRNNWNELKSWGEKKIENANNYLKDPNENWDEDTRGYVLARKFQLEEMLKQMKELENNNE